MVAVAAVVLALVTLLLAVPAPAQIDEGDVEAARQRMISTSGSPRRDGCRVGGGRGEERST